MLLIWIILTLLYFLMVHCGGIKWLHGRDSGRMSKVPVKTWKKIWLALWLLGTAAAVGGWVFDNVR